MDWTAWIKKLDSMYFISFYKKTIIVKMKPEDALICLQQHVITNEERDKEWKSKPWFSFSKNEEKPKYFVGKIEALKFKITRHNTNMGIFPDLRGEIGEHPEGSIIKVSFGLHLFVLCLIFVLYQFFYDQGTKTIFVGFCFLQVLFFIYEIKKTNDYLLDIYVSDHPRKFQ